MSKVGWIDVSPGWAMWEVSVASTFSHAREPCKPTGKPPRVRVVAAQGATFAPTAETPLSHQLAPAPRAIATSE